jgi:CheY-like chemotaxis protein
MSSANPIDKLSILIADDSETVRRLLASLLAALGAGRVFIANNGSEALTTFFRYCPDIIITDAAMAPIDGYELVDTVRTHPESPDPNVPVIMLSALSGDAHEARAEQMGVSILLSKPLVPEAFYKAISEALASAERRAWLEEAALKIADPSPLPDDKSPMPASRSRMLH